MPSFLLFPFEISELLSKEAHVFRGFIFFLTGVAASFSDERHHPFGGGRQLVLIPHLEEHLLVVPVVLILGLAAAAAALLAEGHQVLVLLDDAVPQLLLEDVVRLERIRPLALLLALMDSHKVPESLFVEGVPKEDFLIVSHLSR